MVLHGTALRGAAVASTKLTEDEVHEIRALRGIVSQRDLAKQFGVSNSQICRIQAGTRWTHL